MIRFVGKIGKYTLVVLVLAGAAAGVVGVERLQNVAQSLSLAAVENIDDMIPHEVRLYSDMERLREEYPERISTLKAMLRELKDQFAETEKDRRLCREVLSLCEEDLGELRPKLEALTTRPEDGSDRGKDATVEFRGISYTHREALERSGKILDIREMYENRLQAGTTSIGLLDSERQEIGAELLDLRKEYDRFLGEYKSLEREIDLLRHNEKLIQIARRRDRIDHIDASGWVRSLDELKKAIYRRKSAQEERLKSYRVGHPAREYEIRARLGGLEGKQG